MKDFSEIAENWTEPEYRARPELSYSTLSTYLTLGYDGLEHLFDKKETASLRFGSIVDTIITGTPEEFDKLFFVADISSIGSKELAVVTQLFQNWGETYHNIKLIPATYILNTVNAFEFQKNWKDETRIKVIVERCEQYYNILSAAGNKTIISLEELNKARECVKALKESPATKGYFADNVEGSPITRYYQLKFKAEFDGVGYRNMAD